MDSISIHIVFTFKYYGWLVSSSTSCAPTDNGGDELVTHISWFESWRRRREQSALCHNRFFSPDLLITEIPQKVLTFLSVIFSNMSISANRTARRVASCEDTSPAKTTARVSIIDHFICLHWACCRFLNQGVETLFLFGPALRKRQWGRRILFAQASIR
jgi:hypothetical protein